MTLDIELRIASRIKALRKEKKLSQAALARMAELPYENFRNIERGKSLTWYNLTQVSKALECSIQSLIAEDEEKSLAEVEVEETFRHLLTSYPELIAPCHDMLLALIRSYEAGHNAQESPNHCGSSPNTLPEE